MQERSKKTREDNSNFQFTPFSEPFSPFAAAPSSILSFNLLLAILKRRTLNPITFVHSDFFFLSAEVCVA